jgi:hypothetical protein
VNREPRVRYNIVLLIVTVPCHVLEKDDLFFMTVLSESLMSSESNVISYRNLFTKLSQCCAILTFSIINFVGASENKTFMFHVSRTCKVTLLHSGDSWDCFTAGGTQE